ncbi:MAG: C-type lectin domain-containing protein [Polyangiaceae bacterium]
MACLPSGDLDAYSRGNDVSAPVDGEMPPPASSTPGVDPGPGTGGDQPDPSMLAPSEPPPDGEENNASNGMTGGDAGLPPLPVADAAPEGPCAAGEVLGPDAHCHFIETVALSWDAARASCRARGTGWDLGVVRSADESTFLAAQITAEVWLGASDTTSEGSWSWVTDSAPFWVGSGMGAPVAGAYTNWNVTEPNGGVTTNCARALPDIFGSPTPGAPWADLPCAQLRASICEDHGVVE